MSYAKTQSKNSNGEESRPAGGQLRGGEADAGGDLPQVVVPGSGDHYDDHDQDPHGDQQDNHEQLTTVVMIVIAMGLCKMIAKKIFQ